MREIQQGQSEVVELVASILPTCRSGFWTLDILGKPEHKQEMV